MTRNIFKSRLNICNIQHRVFENVFNKTNGQGVMFRSLRSNPRPVSILCVLTGTCPSSRYGDKRNGVGTEFLGKRSEVIEFVKNTPDCDWRGNKQRKSNFEGA